MSSHSSTDLHLATTATPRPQLTVVRHGREVELHITYEGTRPPLELFSRLSEIGWDAPVPAPPPKDAIDWSMPDPVAGTRHTIRPFTATGIARPLPGRSDVEGLVAAAVTAAATLGGRVEGADVDLRGDIGVSDDPRSAADTVRVTAFVGDHMLDTALVLVDRLGFRATTETVTTRQMLSYRGQMAEAEAHSHRVTFDAPASLSDQAVAALRELSTSPPTVTSIDLS